MNDPHVKTVFCGKCRRQFIIPANPAADADVICECGHLHFWSDFGVCTPGYTVIYAHPHSGVN